MMKLLIMMFMSFMSNDKVDKLKLNNDEVDK